MENDTEDVFCELEGRGMFKRGYSSLHLREEKTRKG